MSISTAEALAITGHPILSPVRTPAATTAMPLTASVSLDDELSDDELEHVVGGLARIRPIDLGLAPGALDT